MNHRIGLYDMILIKDNHISAAGGVTAALSAAHETRLSTGNRIFIEIEAKTLAEVEEILRIGLADRVLLDNMVSVNAAGEVDTTRLQNAVELVDGRLETEASGNVSMETVRDIARTGVDFISCGALTHSVTALDISLLLTTS